MPGCSRNTATCNLHPATYRIRLQTSSGLLSAGAVPFGGFGWAAGCKAGNARQLVGGLFCGATPTIPVSGQEGRP